MPGAVRELPLQQVVQSSFATRSTAASMSGRTPRWVDSSEWMMVRSVSMMKSDLMDIPRSWLKTP